MLDITVIIFLFASNVWYSLSYPLYTVGTIAGTGASSSGGDGGNAISGSLLDPFGVWQDSVGVIFVAEMTAHKIRAVSVTGIITTYAGNGVASSSPTSLNGDGGPVINIKIISLKLIIS
jgi:hypothetical protein